MTHTPITPDLPFTEAGRLMMAEELDTIQLHLPALHAGPAVTAVHETRKAIRRSFTLFKLFAPYFAPDVLTPHHKALRRLMRRLAPCRDLAVFRLKLAAYNETADPPLVELAHYAEERQDDADRWLCLYLDRKRVGKSLRHYRTFTTHAGEGLPTGGAPLLVRHALPSLIFQRVGSVRAWGDIMPTATPRQFHQLRIQFKELRYTLTYFADVLGETSGAVIELTRLMQEHLGHLNDASVAVDLLDGLRCCPDESAAYRDHQVALIDRLTADFRPLYEQFDRPVVRHILAAALGDL